MSKSKVKTESLIEVFANPFLALSITTIFVLLSFGKEGLGIETSINQSVIYGNHQLISLTLLLTAIPLLTIPMADYYVAKKRNKNKPVNFHIIQTLQILIAGALIICGLISFCIWIGAEIAIISTGVGTFLAILISLVFNETNN